MTLTFAGDAPAPHGPTICKTKSSRGMGESKRVTKITLSVLKRDRIKLAFVNSAP
jgi:hypothetical protein